VPTRMATLNNLHYLCADETRASTPEFVDNYLLMSTTQRIAISTRVKLVATSMETVVHGIGDHRGVNQNFRGKWARDSFCVEKTVPEGHKTSRITVTFRKRCRSSAADNKTLQLMRFVSPHNSYYNRPRKTSLR
jgi:hypothetical protein